MLYFVVGLRILNCIHVIHARRMNFFVFFFFFFFFFFFSVVVPSSAGDFSKPSRTNVAVYFKAVMLVYIFRSCPSDRPRLDIRLHVLMCHGVGSVGAGGHW